METKQAKKQLGLDLVPFDTMVKEVVGQYLELLALENRSK
jgi:hypothetical protein